MKRFYSGLLALLLVAGIGFAEDGLTNAAAFQRAMMADMAAGNPAADFMRNFYTYGGGALYTAGGALTPAGVELSRNYSGESFTSDSMADQISYDAFRRSYKQRLGVNRIPGMYGYASANLSSSDALAMAPSTRSSGNTRRQLDCVYTSGFTIWADGYGVWASQKSRDGVDGYKFNAGGPALGFDWSNGTFTLGAATTYNWGKLSSRDFSHTRDTNTWALAAYGQWNIGKFYLNADFGYGYNSFDSTRSVPILNNIGMAGAGTSWTDYHSNSWNAGAEAGMKFNFGNFALTPNVGIRYFHDRRNSFGETGNLLWNGDTLFVGKQGTHVLELPVGFTAGYEIHSGGRVFVPEFKFAWVPELDRKNPATTASLVNGGANWSVNGVDRSAHGFVLGLGVKAKLSRMITAHLNYDVDLRAHSAYEHHLNLGIGFTF